MILIGSCEKGQMFCIGSRLYKRQLIFDPFLNVGKNNCFNGGSPGLVGGYSCPDGRGFKSQHHQLDGHFSHIFAKKL